MDEQYVGHEIRGITEDSYSSTSEMERFVGKMQLLNARGCPGLLEQAAVWSDNKARLTPEHFIRCLLALRVKDTSRSGLLFEHLARRDAQAQAMLPEEFRDW